MIPARIGRRFLLLLIVFAFLLSLATQTYKGRFGLADAESSFLLLDRLLKTFIPIFALVGAFYFSDRSQSDAVGPQRTSVEAFSIALVFCGIWVLTPAIAILITETFRQAVTLIEKFETFGTSIAISGIAYYFSVSAPRQAPGTLK